MRYVRELITLFCCTFLLASCTVPNEPYKSSLILYDTTDDVKALFLSKEEDFLQISELLEREVSFFYENDDSKDQICNMIIPSISLMMNGHK